MKLTAQLREKSGKGAAHQIRRQGAVPGIIYGIHGEMPVTLRENELNSFIKAMGGSKKLFELEVDNKGTKTAKTVVLQDYQRAIYKDLVEHVDFREIEIRAVGTSKAVKLGGVIQIIRHSILVKCRAANIVEHIDVDVTDLDFGGSIHVLDIKYPEGIRPVVSGRNYTLITISGISSEPDAAPVSAETAAPAADKGKADAKAKQPAAAAKPAAPKK
ncbi:hypothetical protein CHS0354_006858 [Potamilus streckersoni]|uniref:50S ribosomal protein L25 n=1 Tax=Potamilus streckersoni TaxID=2493646 RepID=A0AAE0TEA8_9BIVA|nr:hypothetical protein CHS0354_006858 [Potamilus streckersoni]